MDELEKKLLEKAIRKRNLLVRSIQRVCTNIENMVVDEATDIEAAKIDRDDLNRKMSEFQDVQSQIELDVEDDKLAEHENERTRVETIARSAKIGLAEFISARTESQANQTMSRQSLGNESRSERKVKRPEIQIPKFEGDFRKWSDFRNVFESLVVNESAYSNVEKMVYLKQAMQGTAADVIRKFEITEKNFEKAWEKLKTRYENRRATINTHLQTLTQLPLAKSEAQLQKLMDSASDAIESLDAMGVNDPWSYMVSYLVTEKLDPETRRAWELETVKEPEYPSYKTLELFLQQRVRVIESMGTSNSRASTSAIKKPEKETAKSFQTRKSMPAPASIPNQEIKCFDCAGNHPLLECEKFAEKSVAEKTDVVKKRGLCFQCLHKGHMVLSCRAPRCTKCNRRHHVLLHVDAEQAESAGEKSAEKGKPDVKKAYCCKSNESTVFLPSALVSLSQSRNERVVVRTFFDSGSEVNLISESIVKRLRCNVTKSNVIIETLLPGSINVSKACKVKVESRTREFSLDITCQIVRCISKNFAVYDPVKYEKFNVKFADDISRGGGDVDLLIGAEYYERIMLTGKLKLVGEPYLRETVFGWIAIGAASGRLEVEPSKCYFTIRDQLQQFFVLEEVDSGVAAWTAQERKCDEHYEKTHLRDKCGFEVGLPKELGLECLGESRHIAFRQFCALERRLTPEEMVTYKGFMDEYRDLKHMTLVENPRPEEGRCYLPHHAVYKKSSTTTRMRSVFNASSPTASGYSLNDVLMKGPVLQEDLFSIMVRFRCKKFAFTADIEKMYRQVRVKKEDRKLQCILWRDSPKEAIRTYELNTVTYGTKPASYLATKCLSKLAEECESKMPETAAILRQDFYMDDVLTGGNSIEEVRKRLHELHQVLGSASFPLRKFASNSSLVLDGLDKELIESASEFESGEQSVGVLGMRWLTAEDRFAFYARLPEQPESWTKREILSEVSRVFDPLGLLSPITVTLKMLLQALWANQLSWDEPIEGDILDRYLQLRCKLTELPTIHIPRFVGEMLECEFHIFCDASEKAYGAAVYLRTVVNEEVMVRLVCSKTRVAPVKKVSLPRLELCGSVLAAKLYKKVSKALKVGKNSRVIAWSDSTIVLSWLAKPEHPWCTFVANRITKIVEVLPSEVWNHVKSAWNAADVVSRGIEPSQLRELDDFLNGPEFLRRSCYERPDCDFDSRAFEEEKKKAKILLVTTSNWIDRIIERCSSYPKAIRIVAYVIRFTENFVLEFYNRTSGELSLMELKRARNVIIKHVQKSICTKKLEKVDHFVDFEGIMCLRSRLAKSAIAFNVKHPILLPKCRFTVLFVEYLHDLYFHANCAFLRNFLNLEYFVLTSLNRLIRSVVYRCVVCRRYVPKLEYKIPVGQLPVARVTEAPSFAEVGVDFAGPFSVRAMGPSGNRGKVIFKSYIAVFVCMSTKACHLEIVEDLSTKCFIDAFSRFVSRRGMCSNVYSDNGTNFVGAERELRSAFEMLLESKRELQEFAIGRGFSWHFIPQRAPNFGGLWEAAVKSFKTHFRKVVGAQILSFVEMATLSSQIEAVLNSRPLCASNALSDQLLTPAHLCIGRSLLLVPEISGEVVSGSHLARYKLLRGLLDRFWALWHRDYLISLRKVSVPLLHGRAPVVGELVLVKDESSSPGSWPLARIVKLYPGSDDVVRVVDVKLGNKIFRRPVIKLVPLLPEDSPHGGGGC